MSTIKAALDAAYARTEKHDRYPLPLEKETRIIIFSDHHKGAANRADDFRRSHPIYNAALLSYFERGYTLIVLGDAEELWQEKPAKIFSTYERTLELESRFHASDRYIRIWGNHDIDWKVEGPVKKHFWNNGYGGLTVREGILFDILDGDERLGELFLTHGHQGVAKSDRYIPIARRLVQWVWRPYQRLTGATANTPATSYDLRKKHDLAMYEWAAARSKCALITGHTHRPVFSSQTHIGYLEEKLAGREKKLKGKPGDRKLQDEIIEIRAEIEYRKAKDTADTIAPADLKPVYFNTGSCCFPDGDITGIEISYQGGRSAGVYIKLVRWPDEDGNPRAKVIRTQKLKDVFA